jgi:hypothetical protein
MRCARVAGQDGPQRRIAVQLRPVMDAAGLVTAAAGTVPPPARRADAGMVRLGGRDVAGLLLCGATITDSTPRAVAAIIAAAGDAPATATADTTADGTTSPGFSDLAQAPMAQVTLRDYDVAGLELAASAVVTIQAKIRASSCQAS